MKPNVVFSPHASLLGLKSILHDMIPDKTLQQITFCLLLTGNQGDFSLFFSLQGFENSQIRVDLCWASAGIIQYYLADIKFCHFLQRHSRFWEGGISEWWIFSKQKEKVRPCTRRFVQKTFATLVSLECPILTQQNTPEYAGLNLECLIAAGFSRWK